MKTRLGSLFLVITMSLGFLFQAPAALGFDAVDRLDHAVARGDLAAVRGYLAQGLSVNRKSLDGLTPLMEAARSGHSRIAQYLIQQGALVNFKSWDNTRTALMYAVQNGHDDIARLLLKHHANPNALIKKSGMSPLLMAVQKNRLSTVQLLLANGADPHQKTSAGLDAYQLAKKLGEEPLVTYLAQVGSKK